MAERQQAETLEGIRADHVGRYQFASGLIGLGHYVLDAACGCGYGSAVLAESCATIKAVDSSAEAIKYANRHWSRRSVSFHCVDVAHVAGQFDTVVSFETIEHLVDPRPALNHWRRIGGELICSVPNQNVLPWNSRKFPYHFRHYTPDQLEALLAECGWKVQRWYTQHHRDKPDVVPGNDGRTLIVRAFHG